MNLVDDPWCCLIALDDRFATHPLAQEEVRSIVMVFVALTGLAPTVLLDRLNRAVRDELDDKMLGCVGSD